MNSDGKLNLSKRRLGNKALSALLTSVYTIRVKTVDLSYNDVDEKLPIKIESVECLRIAHCKLKRLPLLLQDASIQMLDCSYNLISELNITFHAQPLTKLCLQGNRLTSLPESIGNLSNLRCMVLGDDLSGNLLESLPKSFGRLMNLEELYVARNRLKEFPECLLSCEKLKVVDLSHNQLIDLPEDISQLENLNLSHNLISSLPTRLLFFMSLALMDLSFNRISIVPAGLDYEKIELAGNPCFFQWTAFQSVSEPTLNQITVNQLVNVKDIEDIPASLGCFSSQLCSQCPLRLAFPIAEIVKPGVLRGHHKVPTLSKVCSKRCARLSTASVHADGSVRISESDLVDF